MGMKLGICGVGAFAPCFIPLFKAHPLVQEVVLADLIPERVNAAAEAFGIERTYASLDELCASDVDAIALFTQRQLHGPYAVQVLEAGKHCYSAVPMGMSVDEVTRIVRTVQRTGLLYMLGETSIYYPSTLYCRRRYQRGDFGQFVYAEAQYLHDMDHFYGSFQRSGGDDWERVAGLPPMYYPTHSTSMILSVTGARATHVACLGQVDHHPDGIFQVGHNHWDNVFSNETALMRTSDGGVIRVNEMRRIGFYGGNSVYMSFFGTDASFEENAISSCWVSKERGQPPVDLTAELTCAPMDRQSELAEGTQRGIGDEFFTGVTRAHPIERLPDSFRGLPNGHYGSHQFLADDFVRAWEQGTLPLCNAWNGARWNLPGLVAHESAKLDGQMLEIPDLGDPPHQGGR